MANEEQLSILRQGADVWNEWRAKNIYIYADLNEADLNGADLGRMDLRLAHLRRANLFRADLRGANLSGADLSDANIREANLSGANLTRANLNGASLGNAFVREANFSQANLLAANLSHANLRNSNLGEANLTVANLGGADLGGANLSLANLTKARLSGTSLHRADLSGAKLNRANLTKANLLEARFIHAELNEANVSEAKVGGTVFANSDLSKIMGLENLNHRSPSHISIDTFIRSQGKIPETFLRGCGLNDWEIEAGRLSNPDLSGEELNKIVERMQNLRATQALQTSALFISYSHADAQFVDKLGHCLTNQGVRYWRDAHEPKAGRIETQIDKANHPSPIVLLVLSKNSLNGHWVEHEVRIAKELEKERVREVLYPVALDDSWKDSRWPKRVLEQIMTYNILDFSVWKNDGNFDDMFRKLIDGLELFYKG